MQTFEAVQVSAEKRIQAIRDRLIAREFLYDNPSDYRDGVAAAVDAIRAALDVADPAPPASAHATGA